MTWDNASNVLLPSEPSSDGKSRKSRARPLTAEITDSFQWIAIDAMHLVHRFFNTSKIHLLSFVSKAAVVISIGTSILSHCRQLLNLCPKVKLLFLVFDGETSDLKQNERQARYSEANRNKEEAAAAIAKLAMLIRESDTYWPEQKDIVHAKESASNGAMISDFIHHLHLYLLGQLAKEKGEGKIKCLFAPNDGEAVLASLWHQFNEKILIFCRDYDCYSHRIEKFVIWWETRGHGLFGTYVERGDAFSPLHYPVHASLANEKGLFQDFDRFRSLPMVVLHVLMGSDFFRWGKNRGLAGMGCKHAYSLASEVVNKLWEFGNDFKMEIVDIACEIVFASKAWLKQKEKQQEADNQKRDEFKSAIMYFYYGRSVLISFDDLEQRTPDRLDTLNVTITAGPVAPPEELKQNPPYTLYVPWSNADFFGTTLEQSNDFHLVNNEEKYFPFCDTSIDALCVVGEQDWMVSVCRLLGSQPHPSASSSTLVRLLLAQVRAKRTIEKFDSTTPAVSIKPIGDLQYKGANGLLCFLREECLVRERNPLHKDFTRAKVPKENFSPTDVRRAIRLVYGHISPDRFEVFKAPKLQSDDPAGSVFDQWSLIVHGVVPSMKSSEAYNVKVVLNDNVSLADNLWMDRESSCSCVAGSSVCSHQRAVMLFVGVMQILIQEEFDDEEILDMIPADVLEVQEKPVGFQFYFTKFSHEKHARKKPKRNNYNSDSSDDEECSEVEVPISEYEDEIDETEESGTLKDDGEEDQNMASTVSDQTYLCYRGNLAQTIAETFKGARCTGFPYVRRRRLDAERQSDEVNIFKKEDLADFESIQKVFLNLLITTGGAKVTN